MPPISADNPNYFLTSVTHNRLPVFQTDKLKNILVNALDEARSSAGIKIFAYVIMPDHFHVITDSSRKPSEVLRYINGISARRVINFLKEKGYSSSLGKLRKEYGRREYKYSLWEHHSNTFLITTESMMIKKASYIHSNPVEDGLVEEPAKYLYSSFRLWANRGLDGEEPLNVDIKQLIWKAAR